MKKNKGFTLIETIIALLIVSISLSALVGNYEQNTRYLHYFKDKTLSELFINNLVFEHRVSSKLKIGRTIDNTKLGYKTWYWSSIVTEFDAEDILQVDIKVFASKDDRDNKQAIQSQIIYVRQ